MSVPSITGTLINDDAFSHSMLLCCCSSLCTDSPRVISALDYSSHNKLVAQRQW